MGGIVKYTNQSATRNRKCTRNLETLLEAAILTVYGPGYRADIYSGGQDKKGDGTKRTGSIRHDDYGSGGRALDCYVYDAEGTKLFGVELARLGQYWLAVKNGGCGVEMRWGGIHLDEWTTPPPRGGMFWFYRALEGKSYAETVKRMIKAGSNRSKKPTLYAANPTVGSAKNITASVGKGGVNRSADVEIVQRLINDNIKPSWAPRGPLWPYESLKVDGLNGTKTIGAIEAFQSRVAGLRKPDGRVDPKQRTIALLNEIHQPDL